MEQKKQAIEKSVDVLDEMIATNKQVEIWLNGVQDLDAVNGGSDNGGSTDSNKSAAST